MCARARVHERYACVYGEIVRAILLFSNGHAFDSACGILPVVFTEMGHARAHEIVMLMVSMFLWPGPQDCKEGECGRSSSGLQEQSRLLASMGAGEAHAF